MGATGNLIYHVVICSVSGFYCVIIICALHVITVFHIVLAYLSFDCLLVFLCYLTFATFIICNILQVLTIEDSSSSFLSNQRNNFDLLSDFFIVSVTQVDTMIIQAIGLLDDLDKELNTYAMRVREWYGWHFPELTKIVTDNIQYAKVVKMMGNRANAVNLDFSEVIIDIQI